MQFTHEETILSNTNDFAIRIIGERINPGFKSTKALFDNSHLPGIQALAVKQAETGASYLNVNIGAREVRSRLPDRGDPDHLGGGCAAAVVRRAQPASP
ncbi:MAG: hypothetical protein IAE86_19640 [Burkholderiaceae bacterium]|nr:hypothetical protein [Burkholderiaceae bacterium]